MSQIDTPDNTTTTSIDLENPENSDEEEGGGLMEEVDKFLDTNPDTGDGDDDSEAASAEAWEEGETSPPHPEYVFCPFPHRKPILHLLEDLNPRYHGHIKVRKY